MPKTADDMTLYPRMVVWTYDKYCQEPVESFIVYSIGWSERDGWWIELCDENGGQGGIGPEELYSTREAAEAAGGEK